MLPPCTRAKEIRTKEEWEEKSHGWTWTRLGG
jgi:hypothetical protein